MLNSMQRSFPKSTSSIDWNAALDLIDEGVLLQPLDRERLRADSFVEKSMACSPGKRREVKGGG